jgi:hypothetical protein
MISHVERINLFITDYTDDFEDLKFLEVQKLKKTSQNLFSELMNLYLLEQDYSLRNWIRYSLTENMDQEQEDAYVQSCISDQGKAFNDAFEGFYQTHTLANSELEH